MIMRMAWNEQRTSVFLPYFSLHHSSSSLTPSCSHFEREVMWWKYLENSLWPNQRCLAAVSLFYKDTLYPNKAGRFNLTWGEEMQQTGRGSCWKAMALYGWSFLFFPPPSSRCLLFLLCTPSFLHPPDVSQWTSEVIFPLLLLLSRHFWEGGPCEGYTNTQSSIQTRLAHCTSSQQTIRQFLHTVSMPFFHSQWKDQVPWYGTVMSVWMMISIYVSFEAS